jgi:hypothetical protein
MPMAPTASTRWCRGPCVGQASLAALPVLPLLPSFMVLPLV